MGLHANKAFLTPYFLALRCSVWVKGLESAIFMLGEGADRGSGVICASTRITKTKVLMSFVERRSRRTKF